MNNDFNYIKKNLDFVKEKDINDFEVKILKRNKETSWVSISGKSVKDRSGKIIGMHLSVRDINERKIAEEKLELFKRAVDYSSDAIGMSSPEGKHFYQNKEFDKMFGAIGNNPPTSVYVNEEIGKEVFKTIMAGKE